MTILLIFGIWCAVSVPVSLLAGRWLRGHDPARCEWCRPDLEEDA